MVEKESKVCSVEGCDTPNNTVVRKSQSWFVPLKKFNLDR